MDQLRCIALPARVVKRIAQGRPTVIMAPDGSTYEAGATYAIADEARIAGVAKLGDSHVISTAANADHSTTGLKPGAVRRLWPSHGTVHAWPVEKYQLLRDVVPVIKASDVPYGTMIDLPAEVRVVPLDDATAAALGEARALAGALVEMQASAPLHAQVLAGPVGKALTLAVSACTGEVLAATASLANVATRVPCGDPWATCSAMGDAIAKALGGLPEDGTAGLRDAGLVLASLNACAERLVKRSYPAIKMPDPKWLLAQLAAGNEAGVLSAHPHAPRVGVDQVLVNEVEQKLRDEDYAVARAWAIVRMGDPRVMRRPALLELPIDPPSRNEWSNRKEQEAYYFPFTLLRAFDPPVELRSPPVGRRYAGEVDLATDAAKAEAWPDPVAIRDMKNEQLSALARQLVQVWRSEYEGTEVVQGREDLINALIFLQREADRRGLKLDMPEGMRAEADQLGKGDPKLGEEKAPINPGSTGGMPPISLAQVLEHTHAPIMLRRGIVTVVGGVCNAGTTHNDVDVLLQGPLDEGLRRVIEFRLGRMFPPHISQRVSFLHDPELGGPFTNHMELFDLYLVPRAQEERHLVEMCDVGKADDPHLDLPARRGPQPMVFQWHWRGRTLHGDLRFKVGQDYLVGWTLLLQRSGIPAPKDLRDAERMAKEFDPAGGKYNKPMIAPDGIQATGKSRQPTEWLHMEGDVMEPGEVGATHNLPGYMVEVPGAPEFVEFGEQKPYFHEYFLTGGSVMNGRIIFRQLEGAREGQAGQPFWRAFVSKDQLPSVLDRRAVKTKTMPPDGYSWIPTSLEKQTPPEYRYWMKKGEEARAMRDALVEALYFTSDNVRLVNGKFARVEEQRKILLTLVEGSSAEDVLKAATRAPWVLVYQAWKGQQVVRQGPSREVWRLALDMGDGELVQFELQTDPTADQRVTAIMRLLHGRALWDLDGEVEPGKRYDGDVFNDTKATPSSATKLDSGTATVLEATEGLLRLRLRGSKLRGVYVLAAEEPGGSIWTLDRSEGPGQAIKAGPRMRGEVQVWDPKAIPADANRTHDREQLRPPALFKPQKVAPRPTNEFHALDDVRAFASAGNLEAGIVVEPKWNGFRLVGECWDDGTLLFTEDEQRDLTKVLPGLMEEMRKLPAPFVLDGEGMAVDEKGNAVPRRDLAQYRGNDPVDDSAFRWHVFGLLYMPPDRNLLAVPYLEQKAELEKWIKAHAKGDRIVLTPHRVAHTWDQLVKAIEWASKEAGSEGAMLKVGSSTYSLGGENDLWAKLKMQRTLNAIVYDRHPVQGSPGVYNLFCAVGPVDAKDWTEVVEVDGKTYTVIGRTGNAKTEAKVGDVVAVDVLELLYSRGAGGKQRLHWFGPPVLDTPDPVQGRAFTTDQVIALLERGEIKKHMEGVITDALHLVGKADGPNDECYVFGEVLVPNVGTGEPHDTQGDTYTEEDVRRACYTYMRHGHRAGLMHQQLIDGKVLLLENYLMPADMTLVDMQGADRWIPMGTWMMRLEVLDPGLKKEVRDGKLTGFSVGGTGVREQRA